MEVVHKINEEGRKNGCPMGQCCDICNLYRPTYRTDVNGSVFQEYDCQTNNISLLIGEMKGNVTGVQRAVESARNENIKGQDQLIKLVREENGIVSSQ